jgi:prefoldin subunit 5
MGAAPMPPGSMGYPMDPDQELQFLKDQAQMLAQQLEQISSRIDEIEKTEKKEKKAGK